MEEKQKYEKTTLLGNAVKRSLKLPYPACQEKKRKEKKRKEKKRKEKKRKEKKRKDKTRQDKTRKDKKRGGGPERLSAFKEKPEGEVCWASLWGTAHQ